MTRMERMDFLIDNLTQENPQCRGMGLPAKEQEKWSLLRSLMNLRHPVPVTDAFLQVQDALLGCGCPPHCQGGTKAGALAGGYHHTQS